jgi:hypothetical protein
MVNYQKYLRRTIVQLDKITTRSPSRSTQESWGVLGTRSEDHEERVAFWDELMGDLGKH